MIILLYGCDIIFYSFFIEKAANYIQNIINKFKARTSLIRTADELLWNVTIAHTICAVCHHILLRRMPGYGLECYGTSS